MKDLFYKPVSIKYRTDNIFAWGCLHWGHDPKWPIPIWKQRGFNSSVEHDIAIIKNWNDRADSESIGFLLGDILFGIDGENRLKYLFQTLNFRTLYVMSGNHQSGWKQVFQSLPENIYRVSAEKEVIFVPNYLEAFINGAPFVMSHYPLLSWNGQGKGSIHLFSHVHGTLKNSVVGKAYLGSGIRAYETSVELNPYPISVEEIFRKFPRTDKPITFDHHSGETQNPF